MCSSRDVKFNAGNWKICIHICGGLSLGRCIFFLRVLHDIMKTYYLYFISGRFIFFFSNFIILGLIFFFLRVDPDGPVVIIFATGSEVLRVQTWPGSMDFSERKNPEYDFLRKGSKAVGPVS